MEKSKDREGWVLVSRRKCVGSAPNLRHRFVLETNHDHPRCNKILAHRSDGYKECIPSWGLYYVISMDPPPKG